MTGNDWCLAVHGGVGDFTRATLSPEWDVGARNGLKRAVNAGAAILKAGGHATDAAQASVEVLEDDAHFNAGHGAVFSADGRNELDAAIMDGGTRPRRRDYRRAPGPKPRRAGTCGHGFGPACHVDG